ncbi:hypothetical protein PFISCL1PPCAC_1910, partial [Pristionchus fissidentatus]
MEPSGVTINTQQERERREVSISVLITLSTLSIHSTLSLVRVDEREWEVEREESVLRYLHSYSCLSFPLSVEPHRPPLSSSSSSFSFSSTSEPTHFFIHSGSSPSLMSLGLAAFFGSSSGGVTVSTSSEYLSQLPSFLLVSSFSSPESAVSSSFSFFSSTSSLMKQPYRSLFIIFFLLL